MDTRTVQVCCVSVSDSPLGHKIKSLTSGLLADPRPLVCMPWSQPWGFKYDWDTPAHAHTGSARLLLGSSVAHELFYRLGRFDRILVLPNPDGEPARYGELRVGVAVATGDATKLQAPPVGVGLGEVAVLGA
jgi:hypothetical protein